MTPLSEYTCWEKLYGDIMPHSLSWRSNRPSGELTMEQLAKLYYTILEEGKKAGSQPAYPEPTEWYYGWEA